MMKSNFKILHLENFAQLNFIFTIALALKFKWLQNDDNINLVTK